tara:strand:- start:344 stop:559 length:216 start_codon:yes stop_codon:yes gene_type:complete
MVDYSHLDALELGLSHERERLRIARDQREIQYREIWVAQYEREIASERELLGLSAADAKLDLDEILALLHD